MGITVTSNKKNTSAVVHVTGSNTVVIAGNSAVSTIAAPGEVVQGAYITQVFWGVDPAGYVNLKRNGQIVMTLDSTSYYDFAGTGMPLTVNQTDNITVDFVGTANGYVFFELQKILQKPLQSEYFQT